MIGERDTALHVGPDHSGIGSVPDRTIVLCALLRVGSARLPRVEGDGQAWWALAPELRSPRWIVGGQAGRARLGSRFEPNGRRGR
jgi:hypothetical protein